MLNLRFALFAACFISLVGFGVRAGFGLFMEPLPAARGLDREAYSLALAIQNIVWGIGQPFAGALLDRFGSARVLFAGLALYAVGTTLAALANNPLELCLTVGIIAGSGMACASYVTALAAVSRVVPVEQRAWALGLGTAAGSLGQFILPPMAQVFMDVYGWQITLVGLGMLLAATVPFASAFRGEPHAVAAGDANRYLPASEIVRRALGHRSYVLLVVGFLTCGFQLAFIQFHLPAYLRDVGYSTTVAASAIGAIGLFNIIGAYIAGPVGAKIGYK